MSRVNQYLNEEYELAIIDALAAAERGLAAGVLASPTLIRLFPEPRGRTSGDLDYSGRVLVGLGRGNRGDEAQDE